MAKQIEPFNYQKRTNIEEHNDLVGKINEIVDVINNTNLDSIVPRISKLETDVSAINDTDNVQNTDINNLKEKDNQIDNRLTLNESNINDITKSLVSDVALMSGTTTGNMKVRIERGDAPSIDSNDYNIQKPVSVELVQGSASAMVKAKITLSDGTVLISDDFMFTTEAIGTDVYISSFTFKNGNVAGSICADIGLSNGSTLEANNFVVPTDPNVISTISDLQSRMTAVESETGDITNLKATVDGHTTSINQLNTDVSDLKTNKADVNNGNQSITAGTINANNINKGGVAVATVNDIPDISGKVNIAQGTENAGKVLGIGVNGNVTPVNGSAGGEVWEEVDLQTWPTDWTVGDRIKVELYSYSVYVNLSSGSDWSNGVISTAYPTKIENGTTTILEFIANTVEGLYTPVCFNFSSNKYISFIGIALDSVERLNSGYIFSIQSGAFCGNSLKRDGGNITPTNNYIKKLWRLKKSS